MKNLLVLLFSVSVFNSFSQTVAYDAVYSGWNNIDCVDLNYNLPQVVGHQNNIKVTFFSSITDAQNNINQIPRFYSYTSDNQVLFVRVTSLSDASFTISQVTLNLGTINFPPPGLVQYDFCDIGGNSQEIVYLNNLTTISGNNFDFNNSFCGLDDNQISTTFYTSEQDAQNQTNPVNEVFLLTQNTDIYYRISNTVNADVMIHYFGLNLQSCTVVDDDNDGLENFEEDVNRNGNYFDDDTDKDGLKNYEDSDDDGDGILTINEDYNNNGDPTDDDTNGNGVADYLESNVTLHINKFKADGIKLFPNPTNDKIVVESKEGIDSYTIYNLSGGVVFKQSLTQMLHNVEISLKSMKQGTYFLELKKQSSVFHRIVIKR
jgi:hypothetical protein